MEIVRQNTLPTELRLQLVLGNALEIVFLIRANATLSSTDREVLRDAAETLKSSTSEDSQHFTVSALDILGAAEQSFAQSGSSSLQDQLDELGDALNALAESKPAGLDLDVILDRLNRLHGALASRSSVKPDEVRGFVSA